MKYLNQYRIQRAQDLLARTDRSIADISLDTGYCDQSYFGAVFRKLAGTTPAAYRRRYRRPQVLRAYFRAGISTKTRGKTLDPGVKLIYKTCLHREQRSHILRAGTG